MLYLNNKIKSFENTKSSIVSSGLGRALSMTSSNTWAQIVSKITSVVNRGKLNWSSSNTTYTVPVGYYSGGTLDSRPSYTAGYNSGYSTGYDKGKLDEAASHGGSRSGSFRVTVSTTNHDVDKVVTFSPSFFDIPTVRLGDNPEFIDVVVMEVTKQYMVIRCSYATSTSIGGNSVTGTVSWYAFI